MLLDIESHPAWVCGLKLPYPDSGGRVAASHPAWVCGLKLYFGGDGKTEKKSHPAWVCGLKPVDVVKGITHVLFVTPCVGVWIETDKEVLISREKYGHTLRGCVD